MPPFSPNRAGPSPYASIHKVFIGDDAATATGLRRWRALTRPSHTHPSHLPLSTVTHASLSPPFLHGDAGGGENSLGDLAKLVSLSRAQLGAYMSLRFLSFSWSAWRKRAALRPASFSAHTLAWCLDRRRSSGCVLFGNHFRLCLRATIAAFRSARKSLSESSSLSSSSTGVVEVAVAGRRLLFVAIVLIVFATSMSVVLRW